MPLKNRNGSALKILVGCFLGDVSGVLLDQPAMLSPQNSTYFGFWLILAERVSEIQYLGTLN